MRRIFVLAALLAPMVLPVALPSCPAGAQATCRNKCIDEEQACLKRTGNKGQCGNRAKDCLEKCR